MPRSFRPLLLTGAGFVIFLAIGYFVIGTQLRKTTNQLVRPTTGATTAPGRYPLDVTARFVRGCTLRGASRTSCRCVARELERTMPLSEFVRTDRLIRQGRAIPAAKRARLQAILKRCASA